MECTQLKILRKINHLQSIVNLQNKLQVITLTLRSDPVSFILQLIESTQISFG
jgi:hypothetical protein